MGLHLELSGDLTAKECDAITAMIAVLRPGSPAPAARPTPPEASAHAPAVIPPPPASDTVPAASVDVAPGAPLVDTTAEFTPPDPAAPPPPLDANGLPWDGRIHASTKTLKADKTWTAKRNVAADLVTSVTAELKQNMAATGDGPVFTDPAQAFGGATVPPPPTEAAVVPPPPTEAAVVPPPPTEEPATPAPPANADGMAEFARIMRVVVEKQKAGGLSTAMATGIAQQLGLSDMRGLATRPDLIAAFEALLP